MSFVLWRILYRLVFGFTAYSFLEVIGAQASLLIPTLVVIFVLIRYVDKRPWSSLGLELNRRSVLAFAGGFLLGTAITLILFVLPTKSTSGSTAVIRILGVNPVFALGIFVIYGLAWLGAAALEEVIFRGYLLQTLMTGLGRWLAVLISSILFGLVHAGGVVTTASTSAPDLMPIVNAVLAGILMGIGYLKSGTLWLPIGVHFAVNFTLANILSAPSQVKFPNGVLKINHKSQLLEAQWPLAPSSPGLIEILLAVVVYFAAIGLLLLWRFKPETAPIRSQPGDDRR